MKTFSKCVSGEDKNLRNQTYFKFIFGSGVCPIFNAFFLCTMDDFQ